MTAVVDSLGLLGVFLLMIPESACIPLPSEATLIAAGVGVQHGWLSLSGAIAAATAGNLGGSLIAYGLGRSRLLDQAPERARSVLGRCERLLARRGNSAVFIARLLPLARTFISLPAGAAAVPLRLFIPLTIAGCAIWSTALILAGAAGWQEAAHTIGDVLAMVVVLVLACGLLARARRHRPPPTHRPSR
jgi:membrane protein DedA with SNARE-associated domain